MGAAPRSESAYPLTFTATTQHQEPQKRQRISIGPSTFVDHKNLSSERSSSEVFIPTSRPTEFPQREIPARSAAPESSQDVSERSNVDSCLNNLFMKLSETMVKNANSTLLQSVIGKLSSFGPNSASTS